MFGGDPFGDDPFFGGGGRDDMLDPFGGRTRRASGRDGHDGRGQGERRDSGRRGDPFSLMDAMLGGGGLGGMDMEAMHEGGGRGGGSFTMMSSSTVISGDGYTRTVTQRSHRDGSGPTVSERREHLRDGAQERLSCGRRIGDRSRTITKERDSRGDERTLDTIEGMDAEARALDGFDDEFSRRSSGRGGLLGFGQQAAARPRQPSRRDLEDAPPPRGGYDLDRDEVDMGVVSKPARRGSSSRRWGF